MAESSSKGKKTLWKKEKLSVTCNFSFTYCVFKRIVLLTHKNKALICVGYICAASIDSLPNNKILDWSHLKAFADDKFEGSLTLFRNKPWFLRVCSTSLFENFLPFSSNLKLSSAGRQI